MTFSPFWFTDYGLLKGKNLKKLPVHPVLDIHFSEEDCHNLELLYAGTI